MVARRAVRAAGSAVRTRPGLLRLHPAGLRRRARLGLLDRRARGARGRRRVLGARRHRARAGAAAAAGGADAASLGPAGRLLPRQGGRLPAATVRAAAEQQRRRLRCGVHRRAPAPAVADGAGRVCACWPRCSRAATIVRRDVRLPIAAVVLVFGAIVDRWLLPSLVQSYRVKPDELRLESPYIASNIALTRYGFGLDRVAAKAFPANGQLTPAVLAANDTTIQNLRWWDPRPLLDTYRQLQEIRLYYDFRDVDVDRYTIDGTYRQVMLAARELDQSRLPADAQTWINQHFKFTHGIGLAMSPVNRFDGEGLPIFFVKDIPPSRPSGCGSSVPRSTSAKQTSGYVVVGGGDEGVRLPQGPGQRVHHLSGRRRRGARQPVAPRAVRLVPRRRQAADQQQRHRREPHPVSPPHRGSDPPHRPVSRARPRSLSGDQRRAAGLAAGRLHGERRAALLATGRARRHQLHPQLRQDRRRRLRRDGPLLRRRCRRIRSCAPISASFRRCSSRSSACRRRCASTCAIRRISSSCRPACTAPTT